MEVQVVAGPGAGRRVRATGGRISIGRDASCVLMLTDRDVSRRHAEIDPRTRSVRDLGSVNGTWLDVGGSVVLQVVRGTSTRLSEQAEVVAGSCRVVLRTPWLTPRAALTPDGAGGWLVNRAPRLQPPIEPVEIDRPPPPADPGAPRVPWIGAAVPLLVAVPIALIWRQPMLLAMAMIGPLAVLTQHVIDRRGRSRDHAAALAAHRRTCAARDEQLREAVAAQRRARAERYPDLARVAADIAGGHLAPGSRLWERRGQDADRFVLRLGLGAAPSAITVRREGRSETAMLPDAVITADLGRHRVIGVYGPLEAREAMARSLIGQLATFCSPVEVRLEVADAGSGWAWLSRLPHARDDGAPDDLVVLLPDPARQRRHPRIADLLATAAGSAVGPDPSTGRRHHVICLAASAAELPLECAAIVELEDGTRGTLHRRGEPSIPLIADLPDPAWADEVAEALAPLRDATPAPVMPSDDLPGAVRLLDLISSDPSRIARTWLAATGPQADRLVAPLGRTADGPWAPDLTADGPHALVAGTTGAGKSELLVSLIAALATAQPPHRLTFLLVDYKGGTAFAGLAGLPHVAGVVTDLDPPAARRALTSLRAELRRRERALTGGADPRAVPRLVIVVDEFRVLAEEQPDLLAGLVRVATVGRGLGVHLILATQRPSGVIGGEIRANTNLRICLRVRERADSDDVLEAPDAARIGGTHPGRAVVRVGGGEPTPVQVAHLPDHDRRVWLDAVQAAAHLVGARAPDPPWLPPVPSRVRSADLGGLAGLTGEVGEEPDDAVPYALADLPEEQRRAAVTWGSRHGHLAVVGGPGSGRTTVLRTLAAAAGRLAAGEVHAIDGGTGLADLAEPTAPSATTDPGCRRHLGTVVPAGDLDRVDRLLAALATSRPPAGRSEKPVPSADGGGTTLLLVDGWENVLETWNRVEAGRRVEDLLRLARDGAALGLRLAVAGGRSVLIGPLAGLIGDRLLLPTPDATVGLLAALPADRSLVGPPGRGVLVRGGGLVTVQVAEPDPATDLRPTTPRHRRPDHTDRTEPLRLRRLPSRVALVDLIAARPDLLRAHRAPIGVGGDDAGPVTIGPELGRGLLVCGPPGSGRSTALATLAEALTRAGRSVVTVGDDIAAAPLRRAPEVLDALRRRPTSVLLLDAGAHTLPGIDELADRYLTDDLDAAGTPGTAGLRLVVTCTATEAAVAFRGAIAQLRALRCALLLGPRTVADGEAVGARVGACDALEPGRGLLVVRGRTARVQIALPSMTSAGDLDATRADSPPGPEVGENDHRV